MRLHNETFCSLSHLAARRQDDDDVMRKLIWLTLLVAVPAFAADSRDSMLVSVPWLAAHISDSNIVLLHLGDKAGYEAGHIAGARYVMLSDISNSDHSGNGLTLEMPPPDDLRQRLEALGISDNSRVIVYYGKDWVSPSTRVIFTLDYAGLGDRASLLDGGMPAWTKAGHEVTKDVPAPKSGTLSPLKINPITVDADFVRSHVAAPGFAVVDARDSVFYDGVETGGGSAAHRRGHIAGAHTLPFGEVVDDQNFLKSPDALAALFTKAGVKPGDAVVGYCHIGQQATAMLFAARTLGHRVLLYDGSMQDWSRHPDFPVENPSEKK
jgi:thiosulfate/3-mercaptopyruvate sulfurtransferase